jgi:membrane-associated phospholipid phosphatase
MRGKQPTPSRPCVLSVTLVVLSLVVGSSSVTEVHAQGCSSAVSTCPAAPVDIGLREVAFFGMGIGALMILDEIVWDAVSDASGSDGSTILEPFRAMGNGAAMALVSGGTFLAGLATGDEDLTRTGERLLATMALAAGAVNVTKFVFGRSRPYEGEGALSFHPGTPGSSFYSGHTTMAFAMAAALSEEIDHTAATVILYSAASLAGYSRMHDDQHWLSDVVAGAALGIASAKFVYGRWTIFGIRAPSFLAGPTGASIAYRLTF